MIRVGSDADLSIWDDERETVVHHEMLHDQVGYTPYEGRVLRGWPVVVVSRGRVVVENGVLHAERGTGQYLVRGKPDMSGNTPEPSLRTRERPQAGFIRSLLQQDSKAV
ncbi:D-hydantoinase [compost metagenome]